MANKPGGKMLLIITTCVSVIAAVSLFRDEPQNLLADTKARLYNEQNVVYDRQKSLVEVRWHIRLIAQIVIVHFSMQVKVQIKRLL